MTNENNNDRQSEVGFLMLETLIFSETTSLNAVIYLTVLPRIFICRLKEKSHRIILLLYFLLTEYST